MRRVRSGVRRLPLVAALVAVAVAAGGAPPRAEALTCVPPETVVAGARHAFVGVLTARDGDRLVFRVTEAVRGRFAPIVTVRDDLAASHWPISAAPGDELGVVARTEGETGAPLTPGEFVANQCSVFAPAMLRALAAAPHTVTLRSRRIVVRRGVARVALRCSWDCGGAIVLRARDGTVLGRAPLALGPGRSVVAVRLRRDARRRLARHGRVRAVAAVLGLRRSVVLVR